MRALSIAITAIAFGIAITAAAQDMVEYSHAATKPPVSLQTLTSKVNASAEKSAKASMQEYKTTSPDKKTPPEQDATVKAALPAIFVLTDGKQLESSHYVLTAEHVVIQDVGKEQTIPLTALNRSATIAANQKQGLDLKIPTSTSQMTLSF